jgi:hypothetical protein
VSPKQSDKLAPLSLNAFAGPDWLTDNTALADTQINTYNGWTIVQMRKVLGDDTQVSEGSCFSYHVFAYKGEYQN